MALSALISYDDTENDHDALALGRILAGAGAELTLAYVRHTKDDRPEREALAGHEADALLERGVHWLDDPHAERRVVVSGSTAEGLGWLAQREQADVIVFGSEYRTRTGHVSVGRSAQTLLERGPAALALAPAGYRDHYQGPVATIGVLPGSADEAAIETAFSLAARLQATVVDRERGVDLLVVGSRSDAPRGRLSVSSRSQNAIEEAISPVLVIARGAALEFERTLVTA
ncbi:MAG: universal stress protein [Actinomycetota bacterium]|nr:universal stress protein [Actinomycetota bacterium]